MIDYIAIIRVFNTNIKTTIKSKNIDEVEELINKIINHTEYQIMNIYKSK